MHDQSSRPTGGEATPEPGCRCGARSHPLGPAITEQHADDCDVFDASRARRERDLRDLAGRPPGWTVVRPLADVEREDAQDATGYAIPLGRRARRRWSVEIRSARLAGRDALVRVFRCDGEPCGVIVDESPASAPAGAR